MNWIPRPTELRRRGVAYAALGFSVISPWGLIWWQALEPSHVLWRHETGGELYGGAATSPGRIFLASADQRLQCLAWPAREEVWSATLPGIPGSAPLFDPDDDLLFLVTQAGHLLAHRASDGRFLWMRKMRTARFRATPVCDATTLYLGARDGWVYALEKESGKHRWQVFAGAGMHRGPALADGVVYVGVESGLVLALDAATGVERWAFAAGGAIHASPVVADGVVYIGSHDEHLYAINAATGTLLWRARAFHEITGTAAVAGDRVVFGAWDHHLYCVDRVTGRIVWRFEADDVIEASPLVAGETVYFGSWDCGVYAVDLETGALKWRQQTGSWVTAPPVLSPGGEQILAAGEDHSLYGLGR